MNMKRRDFLFGSTALIASPGFAWALTEGQAGDLIEKLVVKINSIIKTAKSNSAMYAEFERIFRNYADTSYVAAYAMGVDGRRATSAQKRAFSDAFIKYLSRKYGSRFQEFVGGRLEVQSVRKVKTYYEVTTMAYLKGQAPFDITFLVSDRSGKDLFFNMFIEGINMMQTERTEVGALLDRNRGDIDAMIADLKKSG